MSLSTSDSVSVSKSDNASDFLPAKNINDLPDEILFEVVSLVPTQCRSRIRRVSQKWNTIISEIGYHVEPLFMSHQVIKCVPYYPADVGVRQNPAVGGRLGKYTCLAFFPHKRLQRVANRHVSLGIRSEFITNPPISVVNLTWQDWKTEISQDGPWERLLHSTELVLRTAIPTIKHPEGSRISDLLDVFDMIVSHPLEGATARHVTAWYATCEDESAYGIVQPATGKNGIETRKKV